MSEKDTETEMQEMLDKGSSISEIARKFGFETKIKEANKVGGKKE